MAADKAVSAGKAQYVIPLVLRSGLTLGTVLIGSGLVVALFTGDRRLNGVTIVAAFAGAALDQRLVIFGILAVVATPVVEVLALIVIWATQHDWRFVGVGVVVAAILAVAAFVR